MPASFESAVLTEDGVTVAYRREAEAIECSARVLVNAAGPWAPQIARAVRPDIPIPEVDLVAGHAHRPAVLGGCRHLLRRKPLGRPRRFRDAVARCHLDRDTPKRPTAAAPDKVHPLPEEEEYLLAVARHYFPAFRHLTRADITLRFAGLRVLPAATQAAFDRSRETIFTTDREPKPRVLGIYGGKLTGWRAAAAHVLDRISPSLPARSRRAATDQLILRRPT